MNATPIKNALEILGVEMLPNGVKVITVKCADADELKKLPVALLFNREQYGRTGWHSDDRVAYYRTDKLIATKA
jgi:hypothetical protein